MKKLISFVLWGNEPKYVVGAVRNAELRKKYYPDWYTHFHIHPNVDNENVLKILEADDKVMIFRDAGEEKPDWDYSMNRFKVIDYNFVSHVIFRDTDSRLNQREADAVKDWMEKDTALHIMKDHPRHGTFPILAGMWGLNKSKFPWNMSKTIEAFSADVWYHYDQVFLTKHLWPHLNEDCTIHDEFFAKQNFPSPREENQFVGQVFDENDKLDEEHLKELYEGLSSING